MTETWPTDLSNNLTAQNLYCFPIDQGRSYELQKKGPKMQALRPNSIRKERYREKRIQNGRSKIASVSSPPVKKTCALAITNLCHLVNNILVFCLHLSVSIRSSNLLPPSSPLCPNPIVKPAASTSPSSKPVTFMVRIILPPSSQVPL